MVFETFLLNGTTKLSFLNRFEQVPSIPLDRHPQARVIITFENHFSMGWVKSNMAGWGPKFQDQPESAFVSVNQHI